MESTQMTGDTLKVVMGLVAAKYATASVALLLWDMALTFELELRRVWLAPKTFGTTLFILNRYIPFFLYALDLYGERTALMKPIRFLTSFAFLGSQQPSSFTALPLICRQYQIASTVLQLLSIAIVESVLIMRTNALYQSKILFAVLISLCCISIINMFCLFLVLAHLEFVGPASIFNVPGCLTGCQHRLCHPLVIGFWIPFLVFETLVFLLTIWKSFTTFQSFRNSRRSRRETLVDVIIRDGLIYYVVIMAVSLCNFLIWIVYPFASYLAVGLLKSLQAIICSRMLLNLRGMLEHPTPHDHAVLTGAQFGFRTQTANVDLDNLCSTHVTENLPGTIVSL